MKRLIASIQRSRVTMKTSTSIKRVCKNRTLLIITEEDEEAEIRQVYNFIKSVSAQLSLILQNIHIMLFKI